MNTFTTRFAGFGHEAGALSAYIFCIDTFIISLKNKEVISFVPEDAELFRRWLQYHGVRDVEEGEPPQRVVFIIRDE